MQTGCRSAIRSVVLRNVCAFPVSLTALGAVGAGFTTSPSSLSSAVTLAASATYTLTVTFSPTAAGPVSGTLVVGATHSSGTFAYQSALTGAGAATGLNQDRFTVPTRTDVLMIVDNSGSMQAFQNALGANANAFLAYAFSAGVDFNLGVTSTDFDAVLTTPYAGQRGTFAGTSATRVLRSTTPNLLQTFNARVNLGTNGSGAELMFAPAVEALTPRLLTTTNANFLRADAALSVLAFTDADEQSQQPVATSLASLLAVKGERRRNQFSFSFVGPTLPQGSRPANCSYDANGAVPDSRQVQMIAATGGVSSEICNVGNTAAWRTEATRVGQAVFGGRATWFLTARPVPASSAGVTVLLNGVTVPELGAGGTRNWSFDATRQAVVFEARSLPAPGQSVGFDYSVACAP